MTASFGYYAYPWNLHAPRDELRHMQDAGLGHLTVAASYHAGKFVQPRDPRARVYFPEDGTVYFHPARADYGLLSPRVATTTVAQDTLADLCAADIMPIRAWTVLNHNSRLGWQHPDAVARNAFGDPYPYSLCPAHPEVRHYAVTLCADLARGYGVQALLLESPGWLAFAHGYHHEFAQVEVGPATAALLGLCFCRHCVGSAGAAGIDAEALRHVVAGHLADALGDSSEAAEARSRALIADDCIQRYLGWRCTVVTGLCAEIRAAVPAAVAVRVISTCQRPHAAAIWEGHDLAAIAAVTDGLELPLYQPTPDAVADDLRYVLGLLPDGVTPSAILRPGPPDMASAAQLDATLERVTGAGLRDLSFYNFGLLPTASLDWVERAVAAFGEIAR
ncbi:hypothetical protein [Sphingomonas flavalba]|uniref:hypothetical protein n=1 Tax=Sphingomonas flavalba TaxID=2559804 RepID=UPI00109DCA25|nr:hypothetical protein [Sphingomonas flavalba]